MSRQMAFDDSYRGLASQGFKRSIESGICVYRGDGGHKCAVGWIIPDENYSISFEGHKGMRIYSAVDAKYGLGSRDFDWFIKLQLCHDRSASPADMQDRLAAFAAQHGLTIPDLEVTQ